MGELKIDKLFFFYGRKKKEITIKGHVKSLEPLVIQRLSNN